MANNKAVGGTLSGGSGGNMISVDGSDLLSIGSTSGYAGISFMP
jgi:hypothetical protein